MSLVPAEVAAGLALEPAQLELKAANGSEIRVLGTAKLLMRVGDSSFPLECMVVNNVSEILIGLTWLNEFAESWDFRHEVIVLGGSQHKLHGPPKTPKSRKVEVAYTTTVPARSEVNLVARVIFGALALYDGDWITRPAQMPGKLMVARTLVANQGDTVIVRVLNHTDKEVVLDGGTSICDLEEIPTMPVLEEELTTMEEDPIKLLLHAVDSSVSDSERAELAVLLEKYRHVFSQGPLDMGRTDVVWHESTTVGQSHQEEICIDWGCILTRVTRMTWAYGTYGSPLSRDVTRACLDLRYVSRWPHVVCRSSTHGARPTSLHRKTEPRRTRSSSRGVTHLLEPSGPRQSRLGRPGPAWEGMRNRTTARSCCPTNRRHHMTWTSRCSAYVTTELHVWPERLDIFFVGIVSRRTFPSEHFFFCIILLDAIFLPLHNLFLLSCLLVA